MDFFGATGWIFGVISLGLAVVEFFRGHLNSTGSSSPIPSRSYSSFGIEIGPVREGRSNASGTRLGGVGLRPLPAAAFGVRRPPDGVAACALRRWRRCRAR